MSIKRIILSPETAEAKIHRMALEVAEQLSGDENELIIIGIKNNGIFISEKIVLHLAKYFSTPIKLLQLSMNKKQAEEIILSEQIDLTNKNVLLVDDVSNSGKTLLYALKPLLNYYPKRIQTLVLVERMHKFFPVKPDYVGLSIATDFTDYIQVEESEGKIQAVLVQ